MDSADVFNYPVEEAVFATSDKYQEIQDYLSNNFQRAQIMDMSPNELYRIIEDTCSYLPSSTNAEEVCDISLFVHSKITAAVASCMKMYFDEKNITDYKTCCYTNNAAFRKENAFLLVSGDFSGIQKFIYTIPSKGALKSLRGRSFYLEILLECIIDELLETAGLSRANLLYSGGGHFYLLAPATDAVKKQIALLRDKCNEWLLEKFSIQLYLAIGYAECSANDLRESNQQRNIFAAVSKKVNEDKLSRYSEDTLSELFNPSGRYSVLKDGSRECSICHTSSSTLVQYGDADSDTETLACPLCKALYILGEKIFDKNKVFVVSSEYAENTIEVFGYHEKRWLYIVDQKSLEQFSRPIIRLYNKNEAQTGGFIATKLWLADYLYNKRPNSPATFEELAKSNCGKGQGINRLGVLRADVDNLGAAFIAGFVGSNSSAPYKYATLSRYAELSRDMSMFFKYAVNTICCGELYPNAQPFSIFGAKGKRERKVHIVYSGGDDMFLVGAWDELLELAVDIRRAFKHFTGNKLTFSAGMALFDAAYPISKMAEITGMLEESAKKMDGKDSIALFGFETEQKITGEELTCKHIYKWSDFIDKVCGEKLGFLMQKLDFSDKEAEKKIKGSTSLIYRHIQLL